MRRKGDGSSEIWPLTNSLVVAVFLGIAAGVVFNAYVNRLSRGCSLDDDGLRELMQAAGQRDVLIEWFARRSSTTYDGLLLPMGIVDHVGDWPGDLAPRQSLKRTRAALDEEIVALGSESRMAAARTGRKGRGSRPS